jgi:hypothetical protein
MDLHRPRNRPLVFETDVQALGVLFIGKLGWMSRPSPIYYRFARALFPAG